MPSILKRFRSKRSTKDVASADNDRGGLNNTDRDENETLQTAEAEAEPAPASQPQDKTLDEMRREELRELMKDRSLSKEEKARKMEEVKQKYNKLGVSAAISELREAMKDSSLSKEEKARKMEEVKQMYNKLGVSAAKSTAASGKKMSDPPPKNSSSSIGTSPPPPPGRVELSAKAAANKSKMDTNGLFRKGDGKDAMNDSKESYEKQLDLKKPKILVKSEPDPPSSDARRRAEVQAIMKDKSLEKEERRRRIEEVNKKYAAMADAADRNGGWGGAGETNGRHVVGIDLSAKSYAQRPQKELESTNLRLNLKDRVAMYENDSTIVAGSEYKQRHQKFQTKEKSTLKAHSKYRTELSVNVDPTRFAVAENGLYGVQQKKKKNVRHEYGGRFI